MHAQRLKYHTCSDGYFPVTDSKCNWNNVCGLHSWGAGLQMSRYELPWKREVISAFLRIHELESTQYGTQCWTNTHGVISTSEKKKNALSVPYTAANSNLVAVSSRSVTEESCTYTPTSFSRSYWSSQVCVDKWTLLILGDSHSARCTFNKVRHPNTLMDSTCTIRDVQVRRWESLAMLICQPVNVTGDLGISRPPFTSQSM